MARYKTEEEVISAVRAFGKTVFDIASNFEKSVDAIREGNNKIKRPKEEKKMETISWRDLAAVDCRFDAVMKFMEVYGDTNVNIKDAYHWLIKQEPCWLEWVKQNESGKVPKKWIDYIAEQEKPPCEACVNLDIKSEKYGCGKAGVKVGCCYNTGWHYFNEKPKRTVEEIIEDRSVFLTEGVFPMQFTGVSRIDWTLSADYLALAANNFAEMWEMLKKLADESGKTMGLIGPSKVRGLVGKIEKDAAEMGD